MQSLDDQMDKLKEAMAILGFTNESVLTQLNKLSEIISKAVTNRLVSEKNIQMDNLNSAEKVRDFLKANFRKEDLTNIIKEESEKIFNEYFSTILKGCDKETLRKVQTTLS